MSDDAGDLKPSVQVEEVRALTLAQEREIDQAVDSILSGKPERCAEQKKPDEYEVKQWKEDRIAGQLRGAYDHWSPVMKNNGFRWLEPKELDVHPRVGRIKVLVDDFETAGVELQKHGLSQEALNFLPGFGLYYERDNQEGQWRRWGGEKDMAFTMIDLVTLFPGRAGPERFAGWLAYIDERLRAARLGVVIAKPQARRFKGTRR